VPDELARRLDLDGHVGEPEVDGLVLGDRLAERDALARVGERGLERRARHADGLRRDADAAGLEVRERDPVALALGAEPVRDRHAAVLERDLRGVRRALAHLLLDARHAIAGRRGVDDEAGDPFLPAARSVTANTTATSGVRAGRDELLDAVQHVMVAVALGARRDRAGVGADVRLGQAEAAERLAARERARYFAFCVSSPNAWIGPHTTEFCTLTIVLVAPSPAAISSSVSASET
jgi:hypothetical protein